jgi:hypothetical protein
MGFLWFCTSVGALIGALILGVTLVGASGAPQESAGAAIALCFAVIPYVFTRAFELFDRREWQRKMLQAIEGKTDGKS